MDFDELKHWGIFGMKWGVRRYQNEDGSLTDEGREHYNVGPARTKGYERAEGNFNRNRSDNYNISKKNKSSIFDSKNKKQKLPELMSDDELFKMTKRFKSQANFYNAQNDYIKSKAYNAELTKKKSKLGQFLNKILVQPAENVLSRSVEFGLSVSTAAFLDSIDSKYADDYTKFVLKSGNKNKKKDDD